MAFGVLTSLDLYNCSETIIRSKRFIKIYLKRLIDALEMKAYGKPIIEHFGSTPETSGFTVVQMIETSLISAHLVDSDNSAFIDIFSCKHYDEEEILKLTKFYFDPEHIIISSLVRGE
jgi:S-adenosylmethionine/arginine decarboxylase-like enzyme